MNISLVSVIIPMYNSASYILEAIDSVVNQTYKKIEIILVDDGSTDDTIYLVKQFVDEKFILLQQDNKGPASARNLGINNSKGEYITFLDSDDTWEHDKIEKQLNRISSEDNVGLCYTASGYMDSCGCKLYNCQDKIAPLEGNVFTEIIFNNPISTPSVMIPRKVIDKVGLFEESFLTGEDLHLWWRISLDFNVICVDELLVNIRIHGNRTTNVIRFNSAAVSALIDIYKRDIDIFKKIAIRKAISYHNLRKAKELIYYNFTKESRVFILESFRYRKKISFLFLKLLLLSSIPSQLLVKIKNFRRRVLGCFVSS